MYALWSICWVAALTREQYVGWSDEDAVNHYLARMAAKIPHFESMEEKDLNYIKVDPTIYMLFQNYC